MNARGLLARIVAPLVRATEGAFRPGPYPLPITGGWLPDGAPTNFWQCGIDPVGGFSRSAMVEACVSAYAQTVAMCSGDHWRLNGKGGRDRVKNSALSRILRRPNSYQSSSDFLLNATRSLFLEGNAYALALRNDRFEIDELHLMDSRMSMPRVAETGDIFYWLGGNEVIARALTIARQDHRPAARRAAYPSATLIAAIRARWSGNRRSPLRPPISASTTRSRSSRRSST